jgi:outer membrane receptor protein involved in Fe transport
MILKTLLFVLVLPAFGQTTQGLLVGRITDSVTGRPLAQVSVVVRNESTTLELPAHASASGNYSIASLSPGEYRVTVTAPNYQTQQARALVLPVSARIELNFRLRPLYDVFEAGQFRSWVVPGSQQAIGFYGPDVDTSRTAVFNANRGQATPLETSLSDVISKQLIDTLPLIGRDVYTLLLLQPGVASDTATARGLGFSVSGQRPSSSNYLLDGVENNNLLVTGPLSAVTPEFLEEYRISTANFSAEYGRTTGFLANAITVSGTNQFHGRVFFYARNDRLNANGFQANAQGHARQPFTELQPGFVLSGAPLKNRIFLAGGFVELHAHGNGDPTQVALPTPSFIASTSPTSYAGGLLRKYLPAASPTGTNDFGLATIAPANSFSREDGFFHADFNLNANQRAFARAAVDTFREHDISGSPYPDFPVRYRQSSVSAAIGLLSRFGAANQNELRAARSVDVIAHDTPHAEVPTLLDDDYIFQNRQIYGVILPGNPSGFDFRNRGVNWEFSDNFTRLSGRHTFTFGGGLLARSVYLNAAVIPQGQYQFASLQDFAASQPELLLAVYDRVSTGYKPASPVRNYSYKQTYAFVQDSFHVNNRLTFDYGVRYDYFGAPASDGPTADFITTFGPGSNTPASIASATEGLSPVGSRIYSANPSNWGIRAGASWSPFSRTVFRASYGIFYDRLFDGLWESLIQNRYATGSWVFPTGANLAGSLQQIQASGTFKQPSEYFDRLAFQPSLRIPHTSSILLGVEHSFSPYLTLEVHGLSVRGRQLITTDEVNRPYSNPLSPSNPFGRINPAIDNYISYRANQGSSEYLAGITKLRYRKHSFTGQISYTWSHSIDNQSEALANATFNFNSFGTATSGGTPYISSFTRQFASSLDRGNSDFDQRHQAVFYFAWQPVYTNKFLNGWTLAGLGAMRSGLPFTVYGGSPSTTEIFVNQRADLIDPARAYSSTPVPGGVQYVNLAAFQPGPSDRIGSSGRNAFIGPGLFNADVSVSRTFRITESKRLTARADFYNIFNHANLSNPIPYGPDRGVALYGRTETNKGFPLLVPLSETARQIQLFLRFEF